MARPATYIDGKSLVPLILDALEQAPGSLGVTDIWRLIDARLQSEADQRIPHRATVANALTDLVSQGRLYSRRAEKSERPGQVGNLSNMFMFSLDPAVPVFDYPGRMAYLSELPQPRPFDRPRSRRTRDQLADALAERQPELPGPNSSPDARTEIIISLIRELARDIPAQRASQATVERLQSENRRLTAQLETMRRERDELRSVVRQAERARKLLNAMLEEADSATG